MVSSHTCGVRLEVFFDPQFQHQLQKIIFIIYIHYFCSYSGDQKRHWLLSTYLFPASLSPTWLCKMKVKVLRKGRGWKCLSKLCASLAPHPLPYGFIPKTKQNFTNFIGGKMRLTFALNCIQLAYYWLELLLIICILFSLYNGLCSFLRCSLIWIKIAFLSPIRPNSPISLVIYIISFIGGGGGSGGGSEIYRCFSFR